MSVKAPKTALGRARAPKAANTTPASAKPVKAPRIASTALAVKMIRRAKMGRFLNRGFYSPVYGPDQLNRRWTTPETGDALASLPASERARLIALARNTARNSEHLEGILHQLEVQVIGVQGGKAIFTFPQEFSAQQKIIHKAFAAWTQEAEFYEGQNLQGLLKLILRTLYIGGDLALVYDDGVVADTGQIISFDPDCIGNVGEAEFKAAFGTDYTQHQGIIKNKWGQTVGVICSMSQRGESEFRLWNPDGTRAAWTLIKPAGQRWIDCPFTLIRDLKQINGMRGASSLWPGLKTLSDQSDLQNYEIQAAKRNSQIIGQVLQNETSTNEAEIAAEIDPEAMALAIDDEGNAVDSPVAEALEQEHLDLDAINNASVIYDVMPENTRMELFDTKRPNLATTDFSRWLNGGAAWAAGLSKLYSCGESTASYSASMAEMILANSSFRVDFKKLECGFLDWALTQWSRRAQARGEIPQDSELPEDWRRTCVQWMQPPEKALNPVDDANATTIALRNLTTSYHEKLGPDWRDKLKEIADELAWAKANGIPDPRLQTVSGGVIESTSKEKN